MIRIAGRAVMYAEIWHGETRSDISGADIVCYRRMNVPIAGSRYARSLSLTSDLSQEQGAIAARLSNTCRYQIRRAESKDRLSFEYIPEPAARLDEFCAFYDAFALQKSIPPAPRDWLAAACEGGQLLLTAASRDGDTLVWHAYIHFADTALLQHSASCYRHRERDFCALVGRANRWLHWSDMLRFKRLGVKHYDWGGMFEDESVPERAGINTFKRSFGGVPIHTYDCLVPVTVKGRIWLPLRAAWRGWKNPPPLAPLPPSSPPQA